MTVFASPVELYGLLRQIPLKVKTLLSSLTVPPIQESFREAKPLFLLTPLPLDKGKGIKGIGLPLNGGEAPLKIPVFTSPPPPSPETSQRGRYCPTVRGRLRSDTGWRRWVAPCDASPPPCHRLDLYGLPPSHF